MDREGRIMGLESVGGRRLRLPQNGMLVGRGSDDRAAIRRPDGETRHLQIQCSGGPSAARQRHAPGWERSHLQHRSRWSWFRREQCRKASEMRNPTLSKIGSNTFKCRVSCPSGLTAVLAAEHRPCMLSSLFVSTGWIHRRRDPRWSKISRWRRD